MLYKYYYICKAKLLYRRNQMRQYPLKRLEKFAFRGPTDASILMAIRNSLPEYDLQTSANMRLAARPFLL